MVKYVAALVLLSTFTLFAAQPIAVLTAGPGVTVNGKPVPTTGAPNWPLAAGDEVAATANAVLSFPDGSQITLRPGAKIVARTCNRCVVRLVQGAVDYAKSAASTLEICALGHPIQPAPGAKGAVVIETTPEKQVVWKVGTEDRVVSSGKCACNSGGFPTGKIVIAGAAAAGAGAAVVEVTRPDNRSRP